MGQRDAVSPYSDEILINARVAEGGQLSRRSDTIPEPSFDGIWRGQGRQIADGDGVGSVRPLSHIFHGEI